MFEIGKYYDLMIRTTEEYSSSRVRVIDWSPPLLKYETDPGKQTIFNTSSPLFFSAEPGPSPEEIEAAEKAFSFNITSSRKDI